MKFEQRGFERIHVEAPGPRGLAEHDFAAAAEVDPRGPEQRARPRERGGDVPDQLVAEGYESGILGDGAVHVAFPRVTDAGIRAAGGTDVQSRSTKDA
jgi:hypothetical protein